MKTIKLFVFNVFLALALVACQTVPSPNDGIVEIVNLGEAEYVFPVQGGEEIISFKSSKEWTVSSSESWVFISQ